MQSDLITSCTAYRYESERGTLRAVDDAVVREEVITLHLNGRKYLDVVASNDMLTEFGTGFFLAAGIATKVFTVRVQGCEVFIDAVLNDREAPVARVPEKNPESSNDRQITSEEIFAVRKALDVEVWRETGGLHCAVLWHDHACVAVASDIGRHNAVDKVIGHMILHNLNPAECAIGCTGRQPEGMVAKAVHAKIPLIISRAATTLKGAELARAANVTLIGFVRDGRFTVYSHPHRIAGLNPVEEEPQATANAGPLAAPLRGLQYRLGTAVPVEDAAPVEEVITLYLNGEEFIRTVASREHLPEFAVGFFVDAGLICTAADLISVTADETSVWVEAACTSCVAGGMKSAGGFAPLHPRRYVQAGGCITPEEIFVIRAAINAEVWDATGGLHCAVLWHDHRVVFLASDIGRHNAVDKVIGYMILHNLNPAECAIGSTGRQPAGMVTKAANAGVPILVSRAAATDAGVATADAYGVTLICFVRPPRFTVYAHPERVSGLR